MQADFGSLARPLKIKLSLAMFICELSAAAVVWQGPWILSPVYNISDLEKYTDAFVAVLTYRNRSWPFGKAPELCPLYTIW